MDINKEREAFLQEIDGLGYEFLNQEIREETTGFKDCDLNMLW